MLAFRLSNAESQVKVSVFTTAYRKISEQVRSDLSAGDVRMPLVVTDKKGKSLSNGVYYVVLSTRQGQAIAKWVVMR